MDRASTGRFHFCLPGQEPLADPRDASSVPLHSERRVKATGSRGRSRREHADDAPRRARPRPRARGRLPDAQPARALARCRFGTVEPRECLLGAIRERKARALAARDHLQDGGGVLPIHGRLGSRRRVAVPRARVAVHHRPTPRRRTRSPLLIRRWRRRFRRRSFDRPGERLPHPRGAPAQRHVHHDILQVQHREVIRAGTRRRRVDEGGARTHRRSRDFLVAHRPVK